MLFRSTEQETVYSANPAVITEPSVSLNNGEIYNKEIKYSYQEENGSGYQEGLPVKAGKYTIKASIEEKNYVTTSSTITLIINKAEKAPNMPKEQMKPAQSITKVEDVELPSLWIWSEGKEKKLEDNITITATAIYNGEDKGNYEIETIEIELIRSTCDHKQTETRNEKEATCTEKGYSGDTYCTDCNEMVKQGEETPEIGRASCRERVSQCVYNTVVAVS